MTAEAWVEIVLLHCVHWRDQVAPDGHQFH